MVYFNDPSTRQVRDFLQEAPLKYNLPNLNTEMILLKEEDDLTKTGNHEVPPRVAKHTDESINDKTKSKVEYDKVVPKDEERHKLSPKTGDQEAKSSLKFSRGRGLQEGVERTKLKGDVLFFCDVDVLFNSDFLTRCRATPVEGHQVMLLTYQTCLLVNQ